MNLIKKIEFYEISVDKNEINWIIEGLDCYIREYGDDVDLPKVRELGDTLGVYITNE